MSRHEFAQADFQADLHLCQNKLDPDYLITRSPHYTAVNEIHAMTSTYCTCMFHAKLNNLKKLC